jgi:nucleotide-binding universal stress UspA family protein
MYKKILVPLDGSALSSAVLPFVRAVAKCSGASAVLLRIIPEIGMRVGGVAATAQPMEQSSLFFPPEVAEYELAARAYLDGVAAELSAAGIAVQTRIATGAVAEGILDAADEEGADLIAMSTHGRGGLSRFLLGSIASRIVHYAKVPVLLVRVTAEEKLPAEFVYRKILVPLDGSEFSRAVLSHVRNVAICTGATVTLLQAVPEPELDASEAHWILTFGGPASIGEVPGEGGLRPGMAPPSRREWAESIRAELARRVEHAMEAAQANLNAAAADLKASGIPVETMIQAGQPAETILDVAKSNDVDMIAMTTHGRSGIQRFLLGSVADRVVRHAHVPVLLVRSEFDNQ